VIFVHVRLQAPSERCPENSRQVSAAELYRLGHDTAMKCGGLEHLYASVDEAGADLLFFLLHSASGTAPLIAAQLARSCLDANSATARWTLTHCTVRGVECRGNDLPAQSPDSRSY